MDLFGIEWAFYICGAAVMLITLAAARMIFVGEKEMAAAQPR